MEAAKCAEEGAFEYFHGRKRNTAEIGLLPEKNPQCIGAEEWLVNTQFRNRAKKKSMENDSLALKISPQMG